MERVRRARGAQVPESFYSDPLMYQATSAGFLGPRDPVRVTSEDYGIDLEAEIVVVTDDVPMAVTPEQAAGHIQLVGLVNDVSLRNLIPGELAKGFDCRKPKPLASSPGIRLRSETSLTRPTSWMCPAACSGVAAIGTSSGTTTISASRSMP